MVEETEQEFYKNTTPTPHQKKPKKPHRQYLDKFEQMLCNGCTTDDINPENLQKKCELTMWKHSKNKHVASQAKLHV